MVTCEICGRKGDELLYDERVGLYCIECKKDAEQAAAMLQEMQRRVVEQPRCAQAA